MSSITSIVTSTLSTTTSASSSSSRTLTSSSASPSPTQGQQQGGDNPGNFYKNLFYILIGLLAAFGVVSFFSLMRARRRRTAILREAERLGVLVPGVPGYIPIRERRTMTWARSDGSELPDWWEVEPGEKEKEGIAQAPRVSQWKTGDAFGTGQDDFQPLAVVPPPEDRPHEPIAVSPLPFFPNHLAYRASALLPPPSRYRLENPETLNQLGGEHLDLVTIIRMPFEDRRNQSELRRVALGEDDDDQEGVMREWGGIELGIEKVEVERR